MTHNYPQGFSISIRHLGKVYGQGEVFREVLSDINIEIQPGEMVAMCGISGVGKSTLLRIIAGLAESTKGEVVVDGECVTSTPAGIGFVTQDYSRSLFPWLNVSRNIKLAFKSNPLSKAEENRRVGEILHAVGLQDSEKLFPWQLSGGMQQRVVIARALVTNPHLLLLDEPFASVDAQTRFELEDLLARLVSQGGITALVVTHDIDEAVYLADRVITLGGHPAKIEKVTEIDLPRPRSQSETRINPRFAELRNEIYLQLSGAR